MAKYPAKQKKQQIEVGTPPKNIDFFFIHLGMDGVDLVRVLILGTGYYSINRFIKEIHEN